MRFKKSTPHYSLFCIGLFLFFIRGGAIAAEPAHDPADNQPPANILFNASALLESYERGTGFAEFRLIDPDGDSGTFSLVSGDGDDDNGSFRIQSGTFLVVNGVIDYETKPAMKIRVRGTDPGGLFTERSYTINVVDENEAPEFAGSAPTVVDANTQYSYALSVSDPDQGDSVKAVELTMGPSWLSLTTVTAGQAYTLAGVPTNGDIGSHEVRIKATDQSDLARVQRFFVTVQAEGSTVILDQFIYLPVVVRN